MIYSYSRISKYIQCPKRFYKHYILGEDEPINEPMAFGKAAHRAIEMVLKEGTDRASASILAAKETEKETGIYIKPDEIYDLLKWLPKVTGYNLIEKEILVAMSDNPFAPKVRFIPDILVDEEEGEIIDWKTGWGSSDPIQIKVYAYLASLSGYNVKKAKIINLRTSKKNQEIEITQKELDEAKMWLLENICEIESKLEAMLLGGNPDELFPEKANQYCKGCKDLETCGNNTVSQALADVKLAEQAMQQAEPTAISDIDEAKAIGAEIMKLEALIDKNKALLKEFCEKNRTEVPVGTKKWAFIPSVSWSFTGDKLKAMTTETILDLEINMWDYLDFGGASRKKLAKKLKWTDDQLNEFLIKYGKAKESSTFRCVAIDNNGTKLEA